MWGRGFVFFGNNLWKGGVDEVRGFVVCFFVY